MKSFTRVLTINLTRSLSNEQLTIINHLTYSASKLWNVSNYEVMQRNINPNKIDVQMKNNFWFKNLHSQSAQAVCQKLSIAWDNFFKHYTKTEGFRCSPLRSEHTKKPKFQPKDGHFPVKWKKNGFKIIDNKLRLSLSKQTKNYLKEKHGIESKYLWIRLPKILSLNTMKIKEVEIVPHDIYGKRYFILHLIYKKKITPLTFNNEKVMAIDLGIKNLATTVIQNEKQPYIFNGKTLVSKLRWFNKTKAKLMSILSKQKLKTSKRLSKLTVKEKNYVKDYIHKVSRMIVELAKYDKVSKIVIGEMNKGITSMNIGKINNQKLHRIPFGKLIQMIQYKAVGYGITVEQVNESYTSQTCSNCGIVKKSNRKYRGLYICSKCGLIINADVNGALNILKKVVPNPSKDRDSGLGNPIRIYSL